ncbi:hypothetical protein [Rhodoferax sp.]|uniref:hypothetical protein n=1 Tax=Rhodoferax sp. TaxID=50421 RepID=UPI0025F1E71F|nr:hypothetical protein [Rhodoferax sp.]
MRDSRGHQELQGFNRASQQQAQEHSLPVTGQTEGGVARQQETKGQGQADFR